MPAPSGAASLFSGLFGGVSEGLLEAKKQKHDEEIQRNKQLTGVYLKAIDNGDIDPQHGYPLLADIISGSFSSLTGDKKGSKKDKSLFSDVLGDPQKLSDLMLGAHRATKGSPASGAAGPTGLATSGPVPTGQGQAVSPADNGSGGTLASRSGSIQAPPQTSIFRTPEGRTATAVAAKKAEEAFKTDEEIRRYKGTIGQKPPISKPPIGPVGEGVSEFLGSIGHTWETADPDMKRAALEHGVQKVTADRLKKDQIAAGKVPLRADQKRGAQLAEAQGLDWSTLDPGQRQTYTTLGARTIEHETSVKQAQASQRLTATLQMSRAALASSGERLTEMQQLFPHVLAAKIAGEDIAALRPEVIRQQLAKGDKALAGKPSETAQKEALKVVQSATKLAKSQATKESAMGRALGWNDDEETIRKNLIRELSGGQDPDEVETLSRAATTPAASARPATPATKAPSKAPTNPFR